MSRLTVVKAPQILFAKRREDGALVHVADVERGLACGCTCVVCGTDLVARQGEQRQAHFAHAVPVDCQGAAESALHHAVKEILSHAGTLTLPERTLECSDTVCVGPLSERVTTKVTSVRARRLAIRDVRVELHTHDIIPDVVIETDTERLLIEVYVSHRADGKKLKKIQALGWPALEIDARALLEMELEDWEDAVVEQFRHKKWLHHPQDDEVQELHRQAVSAKREELERRLDRIRRSDVRPPRLHTHPSGTWSGNCLADRVDHAVTLYWSVRSKWPSLEESQQMTARLQRGQLAWPRDRYPDLAPRNAPVDGLSAAERYRRRSKGE